MQQEYMITFADTHSAILAERLLLRAGLQIGVMPMPQSVSAGCGICLRMDGETACTAATLLADAEVRTGAWYRIAREVDAVSYREEIPGTDLQR